MLFNDYYLSLDFVVKKQEGVRYQVSLGLGGILYNKIKISRGGRLSALH